MQASLLILLSVVCLAAAAQAPLPDSTQIWAAKGWQRATPASVGLDEEVLKNFHSDIARGKYTRTDSFEIFRCGMEVFARQYQHDYSRIYAKEAKTTGALNARLTGRYNYFDPRWHPYYHGTDLHTMQSVTKTITAIVFGVAISRGDFRASLATPVLSYFDVAKVKHVDDYKRHITVENLLTMTSGMNSEELDYPPNSESPENAFVHMEAVDDWVQYAIDQPVVEEPGRNFVYSSASTELLAYIFQKETGQDIDTYAEKYLFSPLGIKHFWKRDYVGTVDTEGGLYLNGEDLAKIGLLYLNDGLWEGKRVVSQDWVRRSLMPHAAMPYTVVGGRLYWGFNWWLYPVNGEYSRIATGLGGQQLIIFPNEDLIAVLTGWDLLNERDLTELVPRLLSAVKSPGCRAIAPLH